VIHLAWDTTEGLPLILSDETDSYIYRPGGVPVEQMNNTTGTAPTYTMTSKAQHGS
jgi:hypothetical protein